MIDATAGLGRDAGALAYDCWKAAFPMRLIMCEKHEMVTLALTQALSSARQHPSLPWCAPERLSLLSGVDSTSVLGRLVHVPCHEALTRDSLSSPLFEGAPTLSRSLETSDGATTVILGIPLQRPDVVYMDPMFTESDAFDDDTGRSELEQEQPNPPVKRAPRRTAAPKLELQLLAAAAGPSKPQENVRLLQAALAAATDRVVVKRHHGSPPIGADDSSVPRPSHAVHSGKAVRYDVYIKAQPIAAARDTENLKADR